MDTAHENLRKLQENAYPGRGVLVGLDETGESLVQVYWIMGRSENSRNRVFKRKGGRLWTAAADPAKLKDPSLIIYNAMRELDGLYFATNGDQTDTIYQAALAGADSRQALNTRVYEPDGPNFTPRISAVVSLREGAPWAELSILKKSVITEGCERHFFRYEQFAAGYGHCLTTYQCDGSPLPPFKGEPILLPLVGDSERIGETIWGHLNKENRVSLAVKTIPIATGGSGILVWNKYEA